MAYTTRTDAAEEPCASDVHRIEVAHVNGDAYEVDVRGHRLLVDQAVEAGCTDVAPTPTEVFAAPLATCIAFYAGRYLDRHKLSRRGLRVRPERSASTPSVTVISTSFAGSTPGSSARSTYLPSVNRSSIRIPCVPGAVCAAGSPLSTQPNRSGSAGQPVSR
ncbi:hypothetical protein [Streptomyces pseudovenezuelae]|uniref:OsmC family protein n=1 Tax=Streptomyces pseudovenezuelae TaxID=67350 RepID=A0ABZ1X9I5_9ACTN|nr:hypothetical protein [Streptomyces pseudovenezuelae]